MTFLIVALTFVAYLSIVSLNSLFLFFVLILASILSTITLLRLLNFLKLYKAKIAAIILTKENLVDNMNGLKINWNDIQSFHIVSVRGPSKVIRINLKDRAKYLEQIDSQIIRKFVKLRLFDLFIIQTNVLEQDIDELLASMTNTLNAEKVI